ncbi:MAG: RNA polymerase factor sigma-32 [Byssovorax sp.]
MAKSKSEPRKDKEGPARPAEPKKRAPKGNAPAHPAPAAGAAPARKAKPAERPAASAAGKAEAKPAKKGAPRADKPVKKGAPKAEPARGGSRGDADSSRSAEDLDEERSEGDEGHEAEGGDEGHEAEGDSEVVEVVGEIVEDGEIEGEEMAEAGTERLSNLPGPDEAALSRTDPLQAYLREVQRHALLTPDEEKALTVHYVKSQDVRTAARLVTANLRLVVKLAYEYRRAYKNIMDLIQEGNIGLMQAVKRYDPYRGVKLSSYAAWWIRAYILRFILNNWRLVKLGTTQAQRKLFFNLNKEKAKLSAMGIEPSAAEIARRLSVDEKEVVDMDRRLSSGEASLDAPVGDTDGRSVSRLELLPSMTSGPEASLEAREMGELVHDRLTHFRETLKGKDVIIFDKRMVAEEPLTLQELGDEFGISRERVRQLEARLTMKLRQYLKEELGDAVGAG